MSVRKGGQVIAGTPNITTGHHVGEIFYTSRLDNELNGAVEANGATYSVEAFTGEKSVPALLAEGKLPSVSMAEYEAIVSANGSCRAWGWDNGDTFRVPTLKDVYLMAGQAESAGEFISESLPNITGWLTNNRIGDVNNTLDPSTNFNEGQNRGALRNTYVASENSVISITSNSSYTWVSGIEMDASRSSSAYQDGAKVRPDSVRYRAMVQLATGATDEALMTCTGVLSDVTDLKQTTLRTDQITNCITEIPQDIKLELNDGTLTLKAGSKVYVPNGFEEDGTTPKFDVITVQNDLLWGGSGVNWSSTKWLVRNPDGTLFVNNGNYASGSTYSGGTYGIWYDTANNLIKYTTDGGSTWRSGFSLPLAQITTTSGTGATSIDQVFNGFGYIGSTVFALPGVKGLIPNGRNADGSLRNIEFTNDSVKTFTSSSSPNIHNTKMWLGTTGLGVSHLLVYNEKLNIVEASNGTREMFSLASMSLTSGVVSNFTPKLPFQAVDRNDSSWISAQGMPSDRYVDLTLGASSSTYTAPANGWFILNKVASSVGQELRLTNDLNQMKGYSIASTNNASLSAKIPCKKGSVVRVYYSAAGSLGNFRFIYAEGEN